MKNNKSIIVLTFLMSLSLTHAQVFDIKAYKTRFSDVMQTVGEKSRKKILINTDKNPLISFGSKEASLEDTLTKLSNLYGFEFEVEKDTILVKDKASESKKGRGLASLKNEDGEEVSGDDEPRNPTPLELRANGFRYHTVSVQFGEPDAILKQVQSIVGEGIKFASTDTKNKTIVFYGDDQSNRLVSQIVDDLDIPPPQILLDAKVVETTKSFSQDFGVQLTRNAGTRHGNVSITNPSASNRFQLDYTMGVIDAAGLLASLQAGETTGDAKIISNPQVVTGNNVKATLNSTLTFSVRVNNFVNASTGGGGTTGSSVVAGGLQSVTSGLQMTVMPIVLRNGKIKLEIAIDNSTPDKGSSVDGIPGINSTNLKTEMIVRPGQTAGIAGLYKNNLSQNDNGVPFLMNIPIFGHLFKATSKSKARQEIMAFITPGVVETLTERNINFAEVKNEFEGKKK